MMIIHLYICLWISYSLILISIRNISLRLFVRENITLYTYLLCYRVELNSFILRDIFLMFYVNSWRKHDETFNFSMHLMALLISLYTLKDILAALIFFPSWICGSVVGRVLACLALVISWYFLVLPSPQQNRQTNTNNNCKLYYSTDSFGNLFFLYCNSLFIEFTLLSFHSVEYY